MPRGKKGPTPDALDETLQDQAPLEEQEQQFVDPDLQKHDPGRIDLYHCEHDGCGVTGTFEEWTEHSSATGHTSYIQKPIEPLQPALFATEAQIVKRFVNIPPSEDFLNEARVNMQRVVRDIISIEDEKKAFDSDCNERLKPLKEQLRGLDSALHREFEQREVDCEWRVSTEENARILVRLDKDEIIDRKPLTEEDFVRMQDEAYAANAAAVNARTETAAETATVE